MDISVLTEQRREMVINLLKGMKIRKSDGEGFDKDDVYACMQQLCDVYEKSIDDLTVNYETELGELQEKYQKYDENNDLYISLIMEAKKSSNEIINKAKSEVDEILAAGKEQIAQQEAEIEEARAAAAQEKAQLEADLEAAKDAAERERLNLAAGIEAERLQADAVKQQYKDKIAVMDQEFVEIKTNILRTAGKIDGLKAQLEDAEEEMQWELQDEPAPAVEEDEAPAPEEMSFEQLVAKLQEEDAAKAGQAAEVEAPAETPIVEAEIEVPEEAPVEAPFETPYEAPFEASAEAPVEAPIEEFPSFEAPAEAPAEEAPQTEAFGFEPVFDNHFEEPAAEIPAEVPADIPVQETVDLPGAEVTFDELETEIPMDIPAEAPAEGFAPEFPAADPVIPEAAPQELGSIEDLSLEEIPVDLPQDVPAAEEEIAGEISFDELEELFKE